MAVSALCENKDEKRANTLYAVFIVFLFQIGLCLLVHCYGISLVWCAMGGWIVSERKRLRGRLQNGDLSAFRSSAVGVEMSVVLMDISAIVYYAFVSPFITTVAHVCALILGATLSLTSIRLYDEDHGISEATPSTPLVDK